MRNLWKKTAIPLSLLMFLLNAGNSFADDHVNFDSKIDWKTNTLCIEVKIDMSGAGDFIPEARKQAEHYIEEELPVAFRESLASLIVDSSHTAGDLASDSPELIRSINELTYRNTRTFSHISENLQSFSVSYTYQFYPDIVSMFIKHKRPYDPPRILSFVPTADFTGIVIYMKNKFPVHGERKSAELVPCLFPRIFNEKMDLIYEKGMVDPDMLRSRGMAAYSDTMDEKPFIDRIGENPLRILGHGIFGEHDTDIIISDKKAEEILFSEANRKLLQEGRVLIICDLPE